MAEKEETPDLCHDGLRQCRDKFVRGSGAMGAAGFRLSGLAQDASVQQFAPEGAFQKRAAKDRLVHLLDLPQGEPGAYRRVRFPVCQKGGRSPAMMQPKGSM